MSARYRLWLSLLANYPLLAAALHPGMRSACRGCGPATSFCNESFQAIVNFLTCAQRGSANLQDLRRCFFSRRAAQAYQDSLAIKESSHAAKRVALASALASVLPTSRTLLTPLPPRLTTSRSPAARKRCHRGIKVSLHYFSGLRDPSFLSTEKLQSTEVLLRRLSGGLLSTDTDHPRTLLPPARLLKY